MKELTVFAPATLANFNVGYDVLGLSLNGVGDTLEFKLNGTSENRIVDIVNGEGIPKEADKNCCTVVVKAMQEALGEDRGVDIRLIKGFSSGSGMGSSSASSAGAAYGYNELVGRPYTTKELIHFAALGEEVACGAAHIDNVAPALLGGIVLGMSSKKEEIIQLPLIENFYAVSLFPAISVPTADSRRILKSSVSNEVYARQLSYMGAFVASLYTQDKDLFRRSMKDLVIEPMRSLLIPHFDAMKEAAYANDALAFGISGSGPSVFAIADGKESAEHIEGVLRDIYDGSGINITTYINELTENSGARIITK